ncbi:SWIM zinc finger family protein [Flammeovirgaceae bacterium SG7u.111]|nr:SWIM zinc finger family protein [Flammeovirgaceae bacterium SG7u.132]WPO36244.1 SWIM zinc finger family protein [Flammeovirgaceae bacterium SG7u.111]
MTLKDFENEVDQVILERGYAYFLEGAVEDLENTGRGNWWANVQGIDEYEVEVKTRQTQIKEWECECPYDHGPVCKHVVAVFYAIRDNMGVAAKSKKEVKAAKKGKDPVEEIFKKASKEELQAFIKAQFRSSKGLKSSLLVHFAELTTSDQTEMYRTIVQNIYKGGKGRKSYIDQTAENKINKGLKDLLKKAEKAFASNDLPQALEISKVLLEEIPGILSKMDYGSATGQLLGDAHNLLMNIGEKAPAMLKDELFGYYLEEYPKPKYKKLGFGQALLVSMQGLITTSSQEKKFFDLLDKEIANEKIDHYIIPLVKLKVVYLMNAKKEKEALALMEENIRFSEFKEMLINLAIKNKNFAKAKFWCNDVIAEAERGKNNRWGRNFNWESILLRIAEAEKDTATIRKWAEFLFYNDNFLEGYYESLKGAYSKEEWVAKRDEVIGKLLKKTEDKEPFWVIRERILPTLASIYTSEKLWDQLFELLQENFKDLRLVFTFGENIFPYKPKEEVFSIFEKSLKYYAQETGKSIYNDVIRIMKTIDKMEGGNILVDKLIKHFRNIYFRRRAFMEKLDKAFAGR